MCFWFCLREDMDERTGAPNSDRASAPAMVVSQTGATGLPNGTGQVGGYGPPSSFDRSRRAPSQPYRSPSYQATQHYDLTAAANASSGANYTFDEPSSTHDTYSHNTHSHTTHHDSSCHVDSGNACDSGGGDGGGS